MSEELEQTNQDASVEESSPSPSSAEGEAPAKAEASNNNNNQSEDNRNSQFVPYDRFKEVIADKNQMANEAKQLRQMYEELRSQMDQMRQASQPKAEAPKDKMYERLKGIDPEFADYLKELREKAQKVDEVDSWRQQYESKNRAQQIESTFKDLLAKNKVPETLHGRYESELIAAASRLGRQASPKDLPDLFNKVHKDYSEFLDSIKRSERESYVTDKKKDAAIPAPQSKGKMPTAPKKSTASNPEDARSQMIAEVLKEARAARNVG